MSIKNLGHYEGIVEDIDTKSLTFKTLDPVHRKLIELNERKKEIEFELKDVNDRIEQYRSLVMNDVTSGTKLDWAWTYERGIGKPKWKEEFVNALGIKKAEEVAEKYKTNKKTYLGIKYIDPIPETIVQIKPNKSQIPVKRLKLNTGS